MPIWEKHFYISMAHQVTKFSKYFERREKRNELMERKKHVANEKAKRKY